MTDVSISDKVVAMSSVHGIFFRSLTLAHFLLNYATVNLAVKTQDNDWVFVSIYPPICSLFIYITQMKGERGLVEQTTSAMMKKIKPQPKVIYSWNLYC